MKILVLSDKFPPTSSLGGSARLLSFCRGLARRHQLTLASFDSVAFPAATVMSDPEVDRVFEQMIVLPAPPVTGRGRQQLHRLSREVHFSTRVRTPGYHRTIREFVRRVLSSERFDLLFVDRIVSTQYVLGESLPCPAVVDLHDSMTLLYGRQLERETGWLRRRQVRGELESIRAHERQLGRTFAFLITNSPVDEATLRALDPSARTCTIGNGVDTTYFAPLPSPGDPNRLIFTGVMAYPPNVDAVLHLANNILPLVRAAAPQVQLDVVGRRPTAEVEALGSRPGITVWGAVPDIRPRVAEAGIFVCPLRWGSGVKNKILESLAMRRPVVATRLSLDGLDLTEGEDLLVADEPADFAQKVLRLVFDPALAARLARSGSQAVTNQYSWARSVEALEQCFADATSRAVPAREVRVLA